MKSSSSSEIARVNEIGKFCYSNSHNLPCITPNTFCINNICTCEPLYDEVNGQCILKSSKTLGSKCKISAECTGKGEYCNRRSGKCCCLSTHFVLNGKCKPVIYPGQSGCEDSRQCAKSYPGAICTGQNKCECPKGFKAKAFSCFKSKRYVPQRKRSQPLRLNVRDQSNFIEKAKNNPFGISTAVKPGGKCQYSSQCQMNNTEMICIRGICRCSSGKVFTGDMCAESCPSDYVVGKNGICKQGCNSKQLEYNDKCYDQVPMGQRCLVNSNCMGGFRCVNNTCVCPSSMMIRDGLCRQKVGAMKSCANGEICLGGSFCLAGTCVCPVGNIILNEECVPRGTVPPSSACNSTIQCSGGSSCIANICQCPKFQQSVNGICKPIPSESMESACPNGNERCLDGSNCFFDRCECPFGTKSNSAGCILEQKVSVGSPCNSTQICHEAANCINGICQCKIGTVLKDGECRDLTLIGGVGDSCANGEFCIGGSVCNRTICLCPIGTTNQNGICIAKGKINNGEICINGETCPDELLCIDGICRCPQGMFPNNGQCMTTIDSLGECTNSSECAGNSYCDHQSGLCICQDGYQYHDQICIPMLTRTLISPIKICITNADCTAAGEIFMDDRCQMVFAEPGESCLNGETCISNYVCINGSCSCPDGEASRDGNCVEIENYINYQAKPNSPCRKGEFCTGGSFCNVVDGMCRCPADTILQNERCEFVNAQSIFTLPSEKIFNRDGNILRKRSNHSIINVTRVTLRMNRCESNDDCTGGAYCSRYRCICPFNMIMKGGRCQRMFPNLHKRVDRIGKRCMTNYDCTMHNTECRKGICICLPGYHNIDDNECISRVRTFSSNHSQTIIPTVTTTIIDMTNSITEAATNEVIDSGLDVNLDKTGLRSTTFVPLPLIDAGIERIPSSRQTEMIVNISGGVCNETTLCLFFSVCRSGICKCPLGTRISDTECKFMVDVSRLRQFEELLYGGYSILAYTTRPTLPIISQKTNLLPVTTPAIPPISSVKVMTTSTNRNLEEIRSTVHSQTKSKPVKSMNTFRCETSQQCPSRSHCIDGFCSCISGTIMSRSGFCVPINIESSPGMSCMNEERCTGYSSCIRGMCTCPPERNNIVDNECIEAFRDDCTDDPTVCRDGTYCLKDSCVCPTGHICASTEIVAHQGKLKYDKDYIFSKFVQIGAPGEICEIGYTKCTGNSICIDNYCTCISNQVAINGHCTVQHRLVLPNHPCFGNLLCTGGSVCFRGVCRCPNGMHAEYGATICLSKPVLFIHSDTVVTS
ncbi:unnamed protein product [Acanthocheilonema viteae]|uniref:EGF-like domain-containing protein n=1 Tax=Acanthocheilonema viteae TaxID=6277 RepID=A0A498S3H4_ACAVI|nr:unnamed protein product [Acanthocheilonema viteae]